MDRRSETNLALHRVKLYADRAIKASNSGDWYDVDNYCHSIADSVKEILKFEGSNPRLKKRYRVRKNSKRYSKRKTGSRRRQYGKRRR